MAPVVNIPWLTNYGTLTPPCMTVHPTLTVLLVDDDEDDRFFMEQAFKSDSPHARVYVAADGQQAIDRLGSMHPLPDGILLDLNMPGLSGFDVLRHLKRSVQYQAIPVVILTTSEALEDQQQARTLGAERFITKPTTQRGLSALAEQIRGRWTNQAAHQRPREETGPEPPPLTIPTG